MSDRVPPYASDDLAGLIAAHLTAPIPRPSQQRPQIPAAFDDVIIRGMAKRPSDRYGSAGRLRRRGPPRPNHARTKPRRHHPR